MSNPIVLAGASNSLVNGTYYLDGNTNDAVYGEFTNGTVSVGGGYYWVQGIPGSMEYAIARLVQVSGHSVVSMPTLIWTNTVSTNPCCITFGGNGWPNVYYTVTNGGIANGQPYYYAYGSVSGIWETNTSQAGPPTGTLYAAQTNVLMYPTIFNGMLNPMVFSWPLLGASANPYTFTFYHGLSTEPAQSKWDLFCIKADANSGCLPGDSMDLSKAVIAGNNYMLYNGTNVSLMACGFENWGTSVQVQPKSGGTANTYISVTNFVLRVRVQP